MRLTKVLWRGGLAITLAMILSIVVNIHQEVTGVTAYPTDPLGVGALMMVAAIAYELLRDLYQYAQKRKRPEVTSS